MPVGKNRISELEKEIDINDRVGEKYRNNLGKSAKSFNGFLKKNGIQNVHPKRNGSTIDVESSFE